MPAPLTYSAEFEFAHGVCLRLQMFDHHEHRWHWVHRYAPRPGGLGTNPEIVNDLRITAIYLDGALVLPLKVCMNIVIPARLGKRILYGMDVSPGAKTYVEFHYADPDDQRNLRLTRIEVGAFRSVDLPRVAGEGLVRPLADYPFPVLEQLPLTWGMYYRVPFLAEDGDVGAERWPTIDVRARIGGTAPFAVGWQDAAIARGER